MLVFLLCGLWHGAAWTFVAWGAWHGLFLVLERNRVARRLQESRFAPLGHAYALLVVMAGWVFFRADNLSHAVRYFLALAGSGAPDKSTALALALVVTPKLLLGIAVGIVGSLPVVSMAAQRWQRVSGHRALAWAGGALVCFGLAGIFFSRPAPWRPVLSTRSSTSGSDRWPPRPPPCRAASAGVPPFCGSSCSGSPRHR